ncbi:hypothetical protein N431DRAFT_436327 [Stipitochalara longipes BDJ]|nr:hypothetical protein N431DRAFT_436327 [Stipitochalara longipes BDJ]
MRSVKRLAILWFLRTPSRNRGVRPLVEDWTAPVLKLFGSVEELILVLRHYGEEEEGEEVYLINPICVNKAVEKYERIASDPGSGDTLDLPPVDVGFGVKDLDMELLEEYRQNFGEGNPTWAMPRFVEKVAVTKSMKRKLDVAKERAEMALKERGVRIAS